MSALRHLQSRQRDVELGVPVGSRLGQPRRQPLADGVSKHHHPLRRCFVVRSVSELRSTPGDARRLRDFFRPLDLNNRRRMDAEHVEGHDPAIEDVPGAAGEVVRGVQRRAVPEKPVVVAPDEPDELGRLLGPVVLRIDDGLVLLDQPAGSPQHVGLHALDVDLEEVQPGLVVEVVQPHHGDPVLRPRVALGPGNRVQGDTAEVALARVVDIGEREGTRPSAAGSARLAPPTPETVAAPAPRGRGGWVDRPGRRRGRCPERGLQGKELAARAAASCLFGSGHVDYNRLGLVRASGWGAAWRAARSAS